MLKEITEGKAKIKVSVEKKISKKLPVFYNPVMELNRTLSVLLLNALGKKGMQIALPMSGTGIRGIRFLKELKKGIIKNISFNDYDENAINSIKNNLISNDIKLGDKVILSMGDANIFMLKSSGFDYIDVDPFGSPNPFLDCAVKRISREGILAVTATDTSALSGTYLKACVRKYWAKPLRNELMHEVGLRILIRKCQLVGAQFDKALTPIYSYSKDHYMRVFFDCEKGKSKVDEILKNQGMFKEAGPMWLGRLWDAKLAKKIYDTYLKEYGNSDVVVSRYLEYIMLESKVDSVGFYHIPSLAKKYFLKDIPKQEKIIGAVSKAGHKVAMSHLAPNSIRSDISEKDLVELLKKI